LIRKEAAKNFTEEKIQQLKLTGQASSQSHGTLRLGTSMDWHVTGQKINNS